MNLIAPEYVVVSTLISVIFISIFFSLLMTILTVLVDRVRDAKRVFSIFFILFGFTFPISLIAYISGYLSTIARNSAVANMLPAALALIGGLLLYVFGTKNKHRPLIGYCVTVFSIVLFYGSQYGSYRREIDQEYRLISLIATEKKISIIRKNLDLPGDFPHWIVSSEPK